MGAVAPLQPLNSISVAEKPPGRVRQSGWITRADDKVDRRHAL